MSSLDLSLSTKVASSLDHDFLTAGLSSISGGLCLANILASKKKFAYITLANPLHLRPRFILN